MRYLSSGKSYRGCLVDLMGSHDPLPKFWVFTDLCKRQYIVQQYFAMATGSDQLEFSTQTSMFGPLPITEPKALIA